MIDLHIGQLPNGPRPRKLLHRLLGIATPKCLYHVEDGKEVVIAYFVDGGDEKFFGWLDAQADELRRIIELVKQSMDQPEVLPKRGKRLAAEDYRDGSLG